MKQKVTINEIEATNISDQEFEELIETAAELVSVMKKINKFKSD